MIRKAQILDAKDTIELIDLALEDIGLTLTGESSRQKAKEILMEFFTQKQNLYSFENIFVYDIDQKVAGAMCVYESNLRDKFLEPIVLRLKKLNKNCKIDKECFEDEYYIDAIAVNKDFRRRGIATKLIKHAFLEAKKLNLKKCSLVVDALKLETKKFYESLGFYENCILDISNHKYFHMIKDIK